MPSLNPHPWLKPIYYWGCESFAGKLKNSLDFSAGL